MAWKYKGFGYNAPWVFKTYWEEPYTQAYHDAENGEVGDYTSLGGNLNALALEARTFQSAKDYADYKAGTLRRDLKRAQSDLNNPKVLGVQQFRGKVTKPILQAFVYQGSWQHDEFKTLEKKRGVRIEWVDPDPMVRKNIDRVEADLNDAADFYANRWRRLVQAYPTIFEVRSVADAISVHALESIPDDLGGSSIIGWVDAEKSPNAGTRCNNHALDLYPEADKWFVMISHTIAWRRREGLGSKMYERLFEEVAKNGTPALVASQECWVTGGTSDMAKGLWKAIYPRHNHIGEYVLLGGDGREGKKQAAAKCDGMVERIVQRHMKRLIPKQRRDPDAVDEALDLALGEWDDVSGEVFNKALQDMGLLDDDIAEGVVTRVAARYMAATPTPIDHGVFRVTYMVKHADLIPGILDVLDRASNAYKKSGFLLKGRIPIQVKGSSDHRSFYRGGAIQIEASAYLEDVIHELAHYWHDQIVPGGFHNIEIQERFNEVSKTDVATGGSDFDTLNDAMLAARKKWKALEAKRFKDFENDRRRGRKSLSDHAEPPSQSEMDWKDSERDLREKLKAVVEGGNATYYKNLQSKWFPTTYAKQDFMEWFAELLTTTVMGRTKLDPDVANWLDSVSHTGQA